MPFEIRKVSNYGTSHPVVARLKVQSHELIQWADLSKEETERVVEVYFEMADRLLKCDEIYAKLNDELQKAVKGYTLEDTQRVKSVPHLTGLKGELETFLYEAKNYLRATLGAFNIFFGENFTEARAYYNPKGKTCDLVKWATKKFGAADSFTTMLISEQAWVGELIQKRNAVEHPGQKSGTLYVNNIVRLPDGRLLLPTWHLDETEPFGIFPDLETYLDNMLTLGEDILVSCIHHRTSFGFLQFVEIPPGERRAECPMRLTVQIDHSKFESLPT